MSSNPNHPDLLNQRQRRLAEARKPLVDDRNTFLRELATGKKVLDIGCVNHDAATASGRDWLHAHLAEAATTCLGVDVLKEDVERLRERGFNVVHRDVTRDPLEDTFDLIVCGEIIEHLDRPGDLFSAAAAMLGTNGKLVLSTPNPWFINCLLKGMFKGAPFVESVEHTAWFDPCTMAELGRRHGLELTAWHGWRVTDTYTLKAKLVFGLRRFWCALGIRPEAFAKSMIYVFSPQGGTASLPFTRHP